MSGVETPYIYPQFKFLEKQWKDTMLNKGNLKLSYISDFRNNIYPGQIYDKDEGFLSITNFYNEFSGFAKDADGLLKFLLPPDFRIKVKGQEITQCFNIFDFLIYCTSSYIFSESLNQAFKDEKDSCIMITHPTEFFNIVSEEIDNFRYLGNDNCNYTIGKSIYETDPDSYSLTNRIMSNKPAIALIKPPEFINQMEKRAIWINKGKTLNFDPIFIESEKLIKYCIPIDISKVDKKKLADSENNLGVTCFMKSKAGTLSISVHSGRFSIPTPIIVNLPDFEKPLIGLLNPNNEVQDSLSANAEIGVLIADVGVIFNLIFLEDLFEIEYIAN